MSKAAHFGFFVFWVCSIVISGLTKQVEMIPIWAGLSVYHAYKFWNWGLYD